jgi:flavin-dependent dehydrogenase
MHDVIVVGARCGGAPAAMLLARRGHKVLLVDKATFPSDIPHGHFIHRHGPKRLKEWGLLEAITAEGCPAVTTSTTYFDDFPLTGRDLCLEGVAMGYAPRRSRLDKILVDAAAAAGAEVREGFAVQDFTSEAGRITGIRGRDKASGVVTSERATVTIGADGRNSRLAAAVEAPVYGFEPAATCWYFSYWSGIADMGLEVYDQNRRVAFMFPTNDDLTAVFVAWPAEELPQVRTGVERQFMAVLDSLPGVGERVRAGWRVAPFAGATDVPNYYRKPYGPGWALVGDAGAHKDPYLALGICDAFRDAEWLAEALDAGLSGRAPLEAALAGFEQGRNEASRADFEENLAAARFMPLPERARQLRAALRGDPEATRAFYLAREGMVPRETFFNPEVMGALMMRAT